MHHIRVLITGSEGKLGRILTPALSESFDVYGLDTAGGQGEKNYGADVSDYGQLAHVFERIGRVDCVVHLAADSRVQAGWKSVLKSNIIGTRNVYECARAFGIRRVVFASSNHVTGAYEGFPLFPHRQGTLPLISTRDPVRPDGEYASSKVFGEAVARQYFERYRVASVCLRIGTVLEDDDPTHNERHMKTWLSHRDFVELVKKSICSDVQFGIYYGVSNNWGRFWDISDAEEEIGYKAQDDASSMK